MKAPAPPSGSLGVNSTRPFDEMIGRLDRVLSEFLLHAEGPNLDEADRQTIKHHADDLIGVGNAALKKAVYPPTPAPKSETGWLIEVKGRGDAVWWCCSGGFSPISWTTQSEKACRFARKQDAELIINKLEISHAIATEHAWCAP